MNDLHLDSANFDPRKYISTFLKSNTIKDLIKKNNEIQQEIKIHDHEIQSLVFENYSKFISSIDTVKQMKADISKVDDKLKSLDESMNKISELATKVDSTFSVKRKEIQKLDTINKDLQKLKDLCEFPEILKTDLQFYKSRSDEKLPYEKLFNDTTKYYKMCFAMLTEFKTEPLIAPIYKESINKVEEIRSILWNIQNQLKSKNNSKELKDISKKLLTVTEEQISPLRNYFKKAKQKYNEACLQNQKFSAQIENEFRDQEEDISEIKAKNEVLKKKTLEEKKNLINQTYWTEFEADFKFIFEQLVPLIKPTEQIDQLIQVSIKEIFNIVLNNFIESAQKNSISTVYLNLLLETCTAFFQNTIGYVRYENLRKEFGVAIRQKFEVLCNNHILNMFMRLKAAVVDRLIKQKQQIIEFKFSSEQPQKQIYCLISPLKTFMETNLIKILVSIHNIRQKEYFKDKKTFGNLIFTQITEFIKIVCFCLSTCSQRISEEIYNMFHHQFAKLGNQKKQLEELVVKFKNTREVGYSYLFCYNLLLMLSKSLIRKFYDNYYSVFNITDEEWKFQIEKENLATVNNLCKRSIVRNFHNYCIYYIQRIEMVYVISEAQTEQLDFSAAVRFIEEFIEITNLLFPENKRNISKKPSFLNTAERSYSFDTEIMEAKKLHLFEKKDTFNRTIILSCLIKGVLKVVLKKVRSKQYKSSKFESEIYCLGQLCYEIANVDEETIINAFYYLIRDQYYEGEQVKIDKNSLDNIYSAQRNKSKI